MWRSVGRLGSVVLSTVLLIAGCGLLEESPPIATPTPSTANLLIDAGFETTNPPAWRWVNMFATFEPSSELARSGERSLELTNAPGTPTTNAAIQTVNVTDVPEFFSGYYRVDDWPEADGYLQLTVRTASDCPEPVRALRFIIAGAAEEPEPAPPDVRYVFLSRDPPVDGEWTYFAYPLREAFIARGMAVPTGFSRLDYTLELSSAASEGAVAYFDDVYLGPQSANPNRSKETRE
jgi:hypothetical protein